MPQPLKLVNINRSIEHGVEVITFAVDLPAPIVAGLDVGAVAAAAAAVVTTRKLVTLNAPAEYFDLRDLQGSGPFEVVIRKIQPVLAS